MEISKNFRFDRVSNAVAAGQTVVTSSVADASRGENIAFLIPMGAIVAGASVIARLQGGAASDGSDAVDLAGTALVIPDTGGNRVFILEIARPLQPFVRCVIARATQNSAVDAILAVTGGARTLPAAQGTTIGGAKTVLSPAPGTP